MEAVAPVYRVVILLCLVDIQPHIAANYKPVISRQIPNLMDTNIWSQENLPTCCLNHIYRIYCNHSNLYYSHHVYKQAVQQVSHNKLHNKVLFGRDLRKIVEDSHKMVVNLSKIVVDLSKIVVDLSKIVVDLNKTVVDLNKTAVDLNKTVVNLNKTVVDLCIIGMDLVSERNLNSKSN